MGEGMRLRRGWGADGARMARSGRRAAAPDGGAGARSDLPFELALARSGVQVQVGADETAVDALHQLGIEVPTSCGQGICGTCLTRVLEGQPDHRDQYLTDEERAANDQFTPCCSRARSALLVLDI